MPKFALNLVICRNGGPSTHRQGLDSISLTLAGGYQAVSGYGGELGKVGFGPVGLPSQKRAAMINFGRWAITVLMLMETCDNQRIVPLQGTVNFRDLGGYVTTENRMVKRGLIYRSGDLDNLTDADLALLAGMGLKTIVDFRSREEIETAPDRLPPTIANVHYLEVDPGSIFALTDVNTKTGPDLMRKLNVIFVNDAKAQYAAFFRVLANAAETPLLFHCSAGKDRTGYAAALFLAALGVDYETIFADYMLSDSYVKAKYSRLLGKFPQLSSVISVHREYLAAAFEEMNRAYDGVENYLVQELKVDLKLLRDLYTE